jgi:DNA-binding NarL/FixJ family response regulator
MHGAVPLPENGRTVAEAGIKRKREPAENLRRTLFSISEIKSQKTSDFGRFFACPTIPVFFAADMNPIQRSCFFMEERKPWANFSPIQVKMMEATQRRGEPCNERIAAYGERPDVILMEFARLDESSLRTISEWVSTAGPSRILVLADADDSEMRRRVLEMGVLGVLSKEASAEELFRAIQRVSLGETWIYQGTAADIIEEFSTPDRDAERIKIASLTGRELEVIAAVGQGLKNKQIGAGLSISDVTVRHHLTSVFSKLGLAGRLELVIYAYRHGLVPAP